MLIIYGTLWSSLRSNFSQRAWISRTAATYAAEASLKCSLSWPDDTSAKAKR